MANTIRYNVGAHNNYMFFWEGLAPISEGGYMGPVQYPDLDEEIKKSFGDLDTFKKSFSAEIDKIGEASWVWLAYNTKTGSLEIRTTKNHG